MVGAAPDHGAAQDVRGRRDVRERLENHALRDAARLSGQHFRRLVRDGMNVGFGFSGSCSVVSEIPAEQAAFRPEGDRVVQGLHHEEDDGALGPAPRPERAQESDGVPNHRGQPLERARQSRALAGEQRVQERHRVGVATEGVELDVRVRPRMDARADHHVVPDVLRALRQGHGLDGFAVGPDQLSEPIADARQRAAELALRQQLVRAERAGREHHAARPEFPALLAEPGAGALGGDEVAVAAVCGADGAHVDDLALGMDVDPELLGEPQVVFHQRVLGARAAALQAFPAEGAAGALRSLAAEVGIRDPLARRAEEDAAGRAREGVFHAEVTADLLEQFLALAAARHRLHAQHAFGGVVVRPERGFPVVEPGPLGVLVEGGGGPVEGIGIDQAAPADAGAARNEDVLEGGQPQDAAQPERWQPVEVPRVPGGLGEVFVAKPPASLEDGDAVALLGQPQRRHAAAEARADHQPVVVETRDRSRGVLLNCSIDSSAACPGRAGSIFVQLDAKDCRAAVFALGANYLQSAPTAAQHAPIKLD
jgi:hypothetical protein